MDDQETESKPRIKVAEDFDAIREARERIRLERQESLNRPDPDETT